MEAADAGGGRRTPAWGRIQRGGAVALVVLSLGFAALRCATSHEIPFLWQSEASPWVGAPGPVTAALYQWGRERAPAVRFRRRFETPPDAGPVFLRLRAMRRFEVRLNGAPVPGGLSDGERWRDVTRLDLTPLLRSGPNELEVEVANLHGPALLSLRSEGLEPELRSGPDWTVWVEGRGLGAAVPADDTRVNPASFGVETPWSALKQHRDALLGLFTLGVLGFVGGRRLPPGRLVPRLPAGVLAAAVLAWVYVFARKFVQIPLRVGFDAAHHHFYLDFLSLRGSLPLPTDGWSTFHPPLFYLASLATGELGRLLGGERAEAVALKLLPFLSGLASVWVAGALCARLVPRDPGARALALLFAAVLPMNLYASAYFSNESLHTFLAGAAILVSVDALLAPRAGAARLAGVGLVFGLASLTKFTAVAVLPIALLFLAVKLVAVEGLPIGRGAAPLAACAATWAAVAGWFYARNLLLFGDPFMANWGNLPGPDQKWWQQPGFHTWGYFASFGEVLVRPYLSGFHSFGDGVYSTLWGDGAIAGRVFPSDRHPFWSYGFMTLGYWVALPATALLAVGGAVGVRRALRGPDARRRIALSFVATTAYASLFTLLYMTLRLPFWSQAKATYALVAAAPAAVFFALGTAACDRALAARGRTALRALLYGWLAVFAGVLYLGFAA